MTTISKSTTIDAPAAAAWETYARYADVADWHPYMEDAYLDDGSPTRGVGASRVAVFGPRMEIRETVVEWRDNEHMTIAIDFIKGPPSPIDDVRASVDVEGTGDTSTLTLTMRYRPKWGPLGALLDRLMIRRQYGQVFDDMLAASKAHAEGRASTLIKSMPLSGRRL